MSRLVGLGGRVDVDFSTGVEGSSTLDREAVESSKAVEFSLASTRV